MLAVAGGKGGCGKTTTAWCLARALAERGTDVLAVDADVQMPDLHVLAGVPGSPGVEALAERRLERAGHPTGDGVTVVPAAASERIPAATLERLRGDDRFVLLDLPAGAGPDAVGPLRAATATILVTRPTRESLTDAAKTAAVARRLDAAPVGTVVVADDGGTDPRSLLGCPTLASVPPSPRPVTDQRTRERYAGAASALGERNL
ncbi:MAG: MinD/ParA family protein [Haloarculaceae archaeon]